MYQINLNGEIFTKNENFINIKNCNKKITKNIITINENNQIHNENVNCLVVPSKVYNGYNKNPFILSTVNRDCKDTKCSKGGYNSFQIFPFNLEKNIIYIDTIKPNFFSIVNTINMKPNGKIVLLNKNSTINIIKINNLENNDLTSTTKDINGNICHNPNDLTTKSKFTYLNEDIVKTLEYNNNPVIYFFGDYVACDQSQKNNVNNLFVYFDYGNKKELNNCLNKMTFNIVKSGNNKKKFLLPFSIHGTQYNDTISKDFIINFDPRDISSRDGFITIINTQKQNEYFEESISLFDKFKKWKIINKEGTTREFILKNNISNIEIMKFITNYIPTKLYTKNIDVFAYELSNIYTNNLDQVSSSRVPDQYALYMPPTDDLNLDENQGSIYFNIDLVNKIIKYKRQCLTVKFWLVSFNFQNNKIINIKDKKGPYRYINYIGNPKIILYIPPYVLKNDELIRKKSISSFYQTNKNECDIYVSIYY